VVNRNFPAHGKLNISIENGLMIIRARGPANTEMILQYQKEVRQYRLQLSHSSWASLTILSGEPLLPPEASGIMVEAIKQAEHMNLVATAIVFDDVQYKVMSEQFWESIYKRTGLKHRFFDDENQAKSWLRSEVNKQL
jgi:hypothetical protein